MIRRPPRFHQNYTKQSENASKSVDGNENNVKKKLFSLGANHASNPYSLVSYKSRPLQQITNSLPLTHKEKSQVKQDRIQKCLKSQNSITDLSEIVAIDMSSAEKKQPHISQPQTIQKSQNSAENLQSLYNRKNRKQTVLQQTNDNSIRFDDFQILDIYQTTAIKTNPSLEPQSDLRQRRKSGGIRRNSKSITNEHKMLAKSNAFSVSEELNKLTLTDREFEEKSYARNSSQNHTKRSSVDISQILDQDIQKSGQLLFKSISRNKQFILQSDLEKTALTCEMRLILGPILTKFKQKKYSQLNLSTFSRQFTLIMKDFSPKECLEIVKKIEENRHLEFSYQNQIEDQKLPDLQQQPFSSYSKKLHPKYQRQKHQLASENSKSNYQAQNRLQKLRSKVDSFLDKINTQCSTSNYYPTTKIPEKHKASILMSRLTQIEELSGDSEDLASKRDSLPNEITMTDSDSIQILQINQITKEVYVKETQREANQHKSFQFSGKEFQAIETEFNYMKEIQESSKLAICQHVTSSTQSTKRKYFNRSEPFANERQRSNGKIYQKLFPQAQSLELTSRISFKTINLQFNELSKYLY